MTWAPPHRPHLAPTPMLQAQCDPLTRFSAGGLGDDPGLDLDGVRQLHTSLSRCWTSPNASAPPDPCQREGDWPDSGPMWWRLCPRMAPDLDSRLPGGCGWAGVGVPVSCLAGWHSLPVSAHDATLAPWLFLGRGCREVDWCPGARQSQGPVEHCLGAGLSGLPAGCGFSVVQTSGSPVLPCETEHTFLSVLSLL